MTSLGRISAEYAARRHRRRARALREAVAELPDSTRRAMLAAVQSDELIVGAYTDRRGRICPMLAAHRRGARTDVGHFPRAWDAFAQARRPRPATKRELEILNALLQEGVEGPAARWGGCDASTDPSNPTSLPRTARSA
jgi:hypothetical protein